MQKQIPVAATLSLLLLLVVFVAGCGDVRLYITYEPAATPTPPPTATTFVWPTATPTPSPTPEPTPTPWATPTPSVSRAESEQVVRDFFRAIETEDQVLLDSLVSGQGGDVARSIVEEVRRQEAANGVKLTARTRSLEFVREEQRGSATALIVNYAVDLSARAGFFSFPVPPNEGEAVFVVDRVDGRPRIVGIEGDLKQEGVVPGPTPVVP